MAIRFNADADSLISTGAPSSRYTLAGWMQISVNTGSFATLDEVSIAIGTNFHEFQTDSGGLDVGFNDHTASFIVTNPTPQAVGEWWFNAVVVTNSGVAIYQMKEGGSGLVKTSSATVAELFTPDQLMLASDIFGEFLNGCLRGVKIWNGVALTDAELDAERMQFAPVRLSGLFAYWPLSATATMFTDGSGNGHTLTNPSGTGTWTTSADPNIPETLVTYTARQVLVNGTDPVNFFTETLDPNSDSLCVQAILPQGVSPTAVNATAYIQQGPTGMQLSDITRTSSLSEMGITGATGARGATGAAGKGSPLQQAYNFGGRIALSPTGGAVYIGEPSGGVSGTVLMRVLNGVSAVPSAYFQVSPTGTMSRVALNARRIILAGTPLSPANFSLGRIGSGNGQTNSQYGVTGIRGDENHGVFTVVCSATGYTINPIVTLIYPGGRFTRTPVTISKLTSPMSPTAAPGFSYESPLMDVSASPTGLTWMLMATPTAQSTYTISFMTVS